MQCPLCSSDITPEQTLNVSDISKLWERAGVMVQNLFHTKYIDKYKCGKCGIGYYYPFAPGDDEFYGCLADWDWYYKHSGKTEYDFTSQFIKPGMKVLDVGCGIGEFSSYMPAGVNFTGAELSTKSIEIAQSLGRNVQRINIIERQPDLEYKFDIVTCFQVLEHVIHIHDFFKSLVKMCKPGGKIIVAVPNNDSFVGVAKNNILNMPPHHLILWNKKSIIYLSKYYGLIIENYFEERVAPVHLRWFYTTIIYSFFKKISFRKQNVINIGFVDRFAYKIFSLLALPLSSIFRKPKKPGHSLIIVLHRPVI